MYCEAIDVNHKAVDGDEVFAGLVTSPLVAPPWLEVS